MESAESGDSSVLESLSSVLGRRSHAGSREEPLLSVNTHFADDDAQECRRPFTTPNVLASSFDFESGPPFLAETHPEGEQGGSERFLRRRRLSSGSSGISENTAATLTASFKASRAARLLKGSWLQGGRTSGLGTFQGVFIPTISSILGVVMFLRLSWSVGVVGWGGVLIIFLVGNFVNVMTALSVAAVSTNGSVKGGGAYFLISRSLGPELGVSTGLLASFAQAVGTTFALMAFAETFVDSVLCADEHGPEACSDYHVTHRWETFGVASVALVAIGASVMFGRSMTALIGNGVTLVMLLSIAMAVGSMASSQGDAEISTTNFIANAWLDSASGTRNPSFREVLVIIFPAMTSVTAGASQSGQLKDPAQSISRGTFMGIGFTNAIYLALIMLFAAAFDRETLQENQAVIRTSAVSPFFMVVGIMSCTLSGALGNMQGSAKLLQAVARDNLLPSFAVFKQGSNADDAPQVAALFVWFVAQLALLYGRLDTIAGLVTDSYLVMYLFLNLSCFALRISGAPNFRPRFSLFSWRSALAGALSALVLMFLTSPLQGLLALSLMSAFSYYVHITAPPVPWGDVSQALIYHQVRKYLLRLDTRRSHPKFWRPSILCIPSHEPLRGTMQLLDFCNNLKKGGLYVVGDTFCAPPDPVQANSSGLEPHAVLRYMPDLALASARLKQLYVDLFEIRKFKAFHQIAVGPDRVSAFRSLLFSAGLGGLRPNTVCVPLIRTRPKSGKPDLTSYPPSTSTHNASGHLDSGESSHYTSLGGEGSFADMRAKQRALHSIEERTAETLKEIHSLADMYNPPDAMTESQEKVAFCEQMADVLVLGKNLLVAEHFEKLNKRAIVAFREHSHAAARPKKNNSFRFRFRLHQQSSSPGSASREAGVASRTSMSDSSAAADHHNHENCSESARVLDSDTESTSSTPYYRAVAPGELKRVDRRTIDLWSTDEADWNDPSGTLALGLQLAFGLHRTDIWEQNTKLRVIAACQSVKHFNSPLGIASAKKAYEALKKLLKALRVEADVLVLGAVGAALFEEFVVVLDQGDQADSETGPIPFTSVSLPVGSASVTNGGAIEKLRHYRRDPRTQPLTQLEHCAELNKMVLEHSCDRACMVFLPLPKSPSHSRLNVRTASQYLDNVQVLVQGLPPVVLVSPGNNAGPIVTTDL